MGQDNCKPQPGDLIEIDRPRHKHWALYMGNGYVINLTPSGKLLINVGMHTVPVFIRKVIKQRLEEVVQKNTWCVNNESDQYHCPLPVEEIICRAKDYINKDFTYRGFGSNCERFVKKLRYGEGFSDQLRASVGSELQILDMTEKQDSPNPGDMIEIKRGSYEHWALYVGDGYVINFTPVDKKATTLLASSGSTVHTKARVQKELLKVARNDWAVNNKCDCYRTPLPVEEIIWRAECCIGKDVTHDVLGRCSEEFVTNLRYGGELRALLCGEMHVLDRAKDKDVPNPGDLIEIKRGSYEHWALYLGKGHVIHVTNVQGDTSTSSSSGSVFLRRAVVSKEELDMVAGNDTWCVNNKYDCYRTPFPMEEIIRRAEPYIDKELPYRLFLKNCEHFVTMLRYGDGVSEQAKAALQNINSISSVVTAGVGFVSLAVAAGIPVVGFPLSASAAFGAVGGGSLIATIGLASSNIARSVSFAQFQKAGRYILEQSCC
ncbi:uncharacterized protein LOC134423708 isoform X1 [Melospiza melodia melodia]|uniref:uncharacterized protein LOC134423708 isoform X1 n=1 Tax=Melospiza melodia melodia TaxID=1914991 RepID=UPI002FD5DDD2